MIDIDAIRKALAASTPGRWNWWTSCSWRRMFSDQGKSSPPVLVPTIASDGHPNLIVSQEDMRLIELLQNNAEELCRLAGIGLSHETRPDPLGEALNSGDGVYRP